MESLDILQFIEARFQGSAALLAAFPGDLHAGRADPGTVRPFVTVNVPSETPAFSTEGDYSEATLVQFSIFADSLPEARRLRKLLTAHDPDGFDRVEDAPLGDRDELIAATRAGGALVLDPDPGPEGGELWMCTVDYLFLIYRES